MNILAARSRQTTLAAAAYAALTVVMTWPIAGGLARDVPADLGDSLFTMWLMAWVADGTVAILRGAMSFADLWNGNIFHPSTATLTFSEHLVPQALQGAPVYLATGNIVLAYNLVFLATFALSGLGMFLFVRETTGSASAAFVAGLFYGFAPYRLGQLPHIQILSSQWMPFALYGMRRYFDTGQRRALAGATAAFVVQGLSTGYFLFFFAPMLLGYALWEVTTRGRLRDGSTWLTLMASGGAAVLCLLPFLLPYAEARADFGFTRPVEEVRTYSADLLAYMNAPPQLRFWGGILNHHPQAEGDLFPGAVPLTLALAAFSLWLRRYVTAARRVPLVAHPRGRTLLRWLVVATAAAALAAILVALTGGFAGDVAGLRVRVTSVRRTLMWLALFGTSALVVLSRLRTRPLPPGHDLTPFFAVAAVFGVWMSLGPQPHVGAVRLDGMGLYGVFFDWVPGYDGLRVPARFAMVATLALAAATSTALARIAQWGRTGSLVLALVAVVFLAEAYAVPLPMNLTWSSGERYTAPWPTVHRLNEGPLAYRHVLLMPGDTVLLELPFGDQGWDLRYVYYAGLHGKPIVNGYSGYFPDGYRGRAARLAQLWRDGDAAWTALTTAGATHVLVHERGYPEPEGLAVSHWVMSRGGSLAVEFSDGDKLFTLPRR